MQSSGIGVIAVAALAFLGGCGRSDSSLQAAVDSYRQQTLASRNSVDEASTTPAAGENSWLRYGAMLAADAESATPETDGSGQAGDSADATTDQPAPVATSEPTSQPATEPTTQPTTQPAAQFVPWQQRRGPAHPGNFWASFGRDAQELPFTVWDDTKSMVKDPVFWVGMGGAAVAGITIHATGVDTTVNHRTRNHTELNSFWDSVGDAGGNPGTAFAAAGAMYFTTLAFNDTKDYEVSKTLLNALCINGATTVLLKVCTETTSPNGDKLGWPSGHTSSAFCFATVMAEAYGPCVGIPFYGFAGYVGYERIDARNHDFSDVISGMLIGIAIGDAVSKNHEARIFGMDIVPYANPENGAVGVALAKQF